MTVASAGPAATDDELMARVQGGDSAAFGLLYDRHCAMALRIARGVCRAPERAEDAVQDAFFSMWRSRASYSADSGTFKSWCAQIVRHRAVDGVRCDGAGAHGLTVSAPDGVPDVPAPGSVQEAVVEREDAATLRAALGRLPDAQAEVIALAFYGELTHLEIARRLALPQGTVKGRMRLGLKELRRQMYATLGHGR